MIARDRHTEISLVKIRAQLKRASQHEPASARPFISHLDKQLRNYSIGDAKDKAALRPHIEANIQRLEKARKVADGR